MKSVRSEMVALAIALALPASVALVLPYSAIWRAPAEPVRDAPPFAAFVTLTADEEAQAMRRAKSAGRSGEAADAQIRPDDLVLGSLPDDPPTPIGRIEDRVRPSGPRRVAPMPSPYLPTRAAAPPEPIASDPPSARTPSFSKEELLRLD